LRDAQLPVAVSFVSRNGYLDFGGLYNVYLVQDWDFKDAAEYTAMKIREQGKGLYFGVFYDPAVSSSDFKRRASEMPADLKESPDAWVEAIMRDIDRGRKEAKAEASRLLREQVRDFADWRMIRRYLEIVNYLRFCCHMGGLHLKNSDSPRNTHPHILQSFQFLRISRGVVSFRHKGTTSGVPQLKAANTRSLLFIIPYSGKGGKNRSPSFFNTKKRCS
jgi:hypothetical protein